MFNGIKERLISAIATQIASQLKSNPVGDLIYSATVNKFGAARPSDPDVMQRTIELDAWVYVAMNAIGKNLSEAPLIVQQRKTKNGQPSWEKIEYGPLYELIMHPNSIESIDTLIWRVVLSLLSGQAVLLFDKAGNTLHHCDPRWIKVQPMEDGSRQFLFERSGERRTLTADQVVYITMPNPNDEHYGLSPIKPVTNQILLNHHYNKYMPAFFRNGSVPGGILSSDAPRLAPETVAATRKEWQSEHGGPDRAHAIAILGGGLTYQAISAPLDQLANETLVKMPRETLLAVFGTPPVMAGIMEYANYANADAQIKIFWQNTILPKQRLLSNALNLQLTPQFGNQYRLGFDNQNIKALQEDDAIKSVKLTRYVQGGIMTPNEARVQIGLEEVVGGDELRTAQVASFVDPNAQPQKSLEQVTDEMMRSKALVPGSPREQMWNRHEQKVLRFEKQFRKIINDYFDGQLDRVLAKLTKMTLRGHVSQASLLAEVWSVKTTKNSIFDMADENDRIKRATDQFSQTVIRKAGQSALTLVARGQEFNVKNPYVQRVLAGFHNRITRINDVTYDEIKQVLKDAYDEGWAITEIEKTLRDMYTDFTKTRSTRIAMTEMNGIVNGGSLAGYKQGGIEKKEWLTAPGARYPRHELVDGLDGQIVGIDEPFDVAGELLYYPGDENGTPENVINCHCTIAPVVDTEAA